MSGKLILKMHFKDNLIRLFAYWLSINLIFSGIVPCTELYEVKDLDCLFEFKTRPIREHNITAARDPHKISQGSKVLWAVILKKWHND